MATITLQEQLFYNIDKLRTLIEDSIVPLHNIKDSYIPFIGSALYISIDESHFLVSANHVVESLLHDWAIPEQQEYQDITFHGTSELETDFCFAKLDKPLRKFRPIKIDKIKRLDNDNCFLIAVGYPETKIKQYKKIVNATLEIIISRECPIEDYNSIKANKKYNIVTNFNSNEIINSNNKRTKLPFPNGMSGGGLFKVSNSIIFEETQLYLTGILTRWGASNKKNMVSTRIEYVLAAIKKMFPDVNIPDQLIVGINVREK